MSVGDTRKQFAQRIQRTLTAVNNAIASGRIKLEADGTIEPRQAMLDWFASGDSRLSNTGKVGTNGHSHGSALAAAKARHAENENRLVEIEIEQKLRTLLPRKEVEDEAFAQARRTRDALLSIPARLAPVVAGLNTTEECLKAIEGEIRSVIDGLSVKSKS